MRVDPPSGSGPVLRVDGVSKAFPGVVANDNVTLDLHPGEIHALVGENGAGKSTLVGILYGLLRPDEGRVLIDGVPTSIPTPRHARSLGIGLVQQHFSLIPTLSPAQNLVLALRGTGRAANPAQARRLLADLCATFGFTVPPDVPVERLSISEQQRAEVLKALAADVRILALDEPNALLTPAEWDELSGVLRRLADAGTAIVLISHKLDDVMRLADRVSVLRRGRVVASELVTDIDVARLGALMVGTLPTPTEITRQESTGPVRLRVRDLEIAGAGAPALTGVDLDLAAGEIVGLAGVEGSGQVELTEALVGIRVPARGTIALAGNDITRTDIRQRQRLGIGHVPADRHASGLVESLTVAENMLLPVLDTRAFSRRGLLARKAIAAHTAQLMSEFDVRGRGPDTPAGDLSGGNQQKVVLARELSREPTVLICCYATRGLDFAATEAVRRQVVAARDAGAAVLYASVDLEELLELSDRIVVMNTGRVVGELRRHEASTERLGAMMGGRWAA